MIERIKAPVYSARAPLSTATDQQKQDTDRLATALMSAFSWDKTEEGSAFWCSVHDRLKQIAKDGILKD